MSVLKLSMLCSENCTLKSVKALQEPLRSMRFKEG